MKSCIRGVRRLTGVARYLMTNWELTPHFPERSCMSRFILVIVYKISDTAPGRIGAFFLLFIYYLLVYVFIYVYIYLFIYLFIYVFIYLFIHLCIYLFI